MKKEIDIKEKEEQLFVPKVVKDGAGPLFEDEDVNFDCEEAWGWNHANPGYFRE